jgi:hypothetical protein
MGVVRWLHADVKVDTEAKCHGGAVFDSHEVAQAAFVSELRSVYPLTW